MKQEEKYDLVLENSLQYTSNIEPLLNSIDELDETSSTANVSQYKRLIRKLIRRVNDNSDLKNFCSVLPTKTPSGKIGVFGKKLVGKSSDKNSVLDDLRIIKLADSSSFTEGGSISSTGNAGVGEVLHVESEGGLILVKVTSGVFAPADAVDNVASFSSSETTITAIYSASHMVGTLLKDYAGQYSTTAGEVIDDYNQVEHKVTLQDVNVTSKFVTTGYTLEALRDLINMYGSQYKDTFITSTESVVKDIERAKIFLFMRNNAYVRTNIVLSSSSGLSINQSLEALYARVNQSIGAIGTNTGIGGNYAVVASSNVYAGLQSLLKDSIRTKSDGTVILPNGATLTEDGYSPQDYLVVALNTKVTDNSAVIFSPYSVDIISAKSSEDFSENIKVQSRSDIINNPLATFENDQAKNEMMEYTVVEGFSSLTNVF